MLNPALVLAAALGYERTDKFDRITIHHIANALRRCDDDELMIMMMMLLQLMDRRCHLCQVHRLFTQQSVLNVDLTTLSLSLNLSLCLSLSVCLSLSYSVCLSVNFDSFVYSG